MIVNPTTAPSISITSNANTICSDTNIQFTATPLNAGSTPSYQWKLNGNNIGTNSSVFNSSLINNGWRRDLHFFPSLNKEEWRWHIQGYEIPEKLLDELFKRVVNWDFLSKIRKIIDRNGCQTSPYCDVSHEIRHILIGSKMVGVS